jgi:hypothetical protein
MHFKEGIWHLSKSKKMEKSLQLFLGMLIT